MVGYGGKMLSSLAQLPQAKRLQAIANTGDVTKVKAVILHEYGFDATEEYCRDLIAFVDSMMARILEPDRG